MVGLFRIGVVLNSGINEDRYVKLGKIVFYFCFCVDIFGVFC